MATEIVPNYRRNWLQGGTYFFTINLENRTSDLLVQYMNDLKAAVNKVKSKHPFFNHAWVVLPDHMHCIWQLTEADPDFATRIRLIKSYFTQSVSARHKGFQNRNHRGEAQIWQRRFWEHTIKDDLDLERHIEYVHINPMKHGYVDKVKEWPWSSFHVYVEKGIYCQDWAGSTEDLAPFDFGE